MTLLMKGASKNLKWKEATDIAFQKLKQAFNTAPIFQHPKLSFMVEVDAMDSWVRAVLSQGFRERPTLHPDFIHISSAQHKVITKL